MPLFVCAKLHKKRFADIVLALHTVLPGMISTVL